MRGYSFDISKIHNYEKVDLLEVKEGQLDFEFIHLKNKLLKRDYNKFLEIENIIIPEVHPIFIKTIGPVSSWEVLLRRDFF